MKNRLKPLVFRLHLQEQEAQQEEQRLRQDISVVAAAAGRFGEAITSSGDMERQILAEQGAPIHQLQSLWDRRHDLQADATAVAQRQAGLEEEASAQRKTMAQISKRLRVLDTHHRRVLQDERDIRNRVQEREIEDLWLTRWEPLT